MHLYFSHALVIVFIESSLQKYRFVAIFRFSDVSLAG